MRAAQVLTLAVDALGALLILVLVVLAYYVISYAVLYLVGKALPLAGRRRRS